MRQHQYFKNGRQITKDEALDPITGVMRSGVIARVPMSLRDAASSDTRLCITDAVGQSGETGVANRAGWRLPTDPHFYDQKIIADYEYRRDLETAYLGDRQKKKTKFDPAGRVIETSTEEEDDPEDRDCRDADVGPQGAGERGQSRRSQVGDPCTLNGESGHVVRGKDGKLFCQIDNPSRRAGNYSPPLDHQTTQQIARDHEIWKNEQDRRTRQELSNAYRGQS